MPEVEECARCLYDTKHPFGLLLDSEGICGGCRVFEEKFSLDWPGRLGTLAKDLQSRKGEKYDCVLPLQGTPEYFYALYVLQEKLGLRVLGVIYNNHFNTDVGIRNLARIREVFNIDCVQFSPSTEKYRKLIRESILQLGSVRWPALAGERAYVLQVAIRLKIPTIVWLTHQATEQVGAFSYIEEVEMSRAGWHSYDLLGMEPIEIASVSSTLRHSELGELNYPDDIALERSGVKGIYLSNYLPWDSREYSEYSVSHFGALSAQQARTFDVHDRPSDLTYMSIHDLLKERKLGYSRVRDSLVREIRFGRLSKLVARELESHFQGHFPEEQLESFAKWLHTDIDALSLMMRARFPGIRLLDMEKKNLDEFSETSLSQEAREFCVDYGRSAFSSATTSSIVNVGKGIDLREKI